MTLPHLRGRAVFLPGLSQFPACSMAFTALTIRDVPKREAPRRRKSYAS